MTSYHGNLDIYFSTSLKKTVQKFTVIDKDYIEKKGCVLHIEFR
jgi:hypothetical protein